MIPRLPGAKMHSTIVVPYVCGCLVHHGEKILGRHEQAHCPALALLDETDHYLQRY